MMSTSRSQYTVNVMGDSEPEDPAILMMRQRSFVSWINACLESKGVRVNNIEGDMESGVVLIKLLEHLSHGKKMPGRYYAKPKIKIQKIQNLQVAFKFMREERIAIGNTKPNDILKKDEGPMLRLLWILTLHYQLRYTMSADANIDTVLFLLKRVLLVWINSVLPGRNITNLNSDWRSGRNLSALVDYCKPGLIPNYAQLKEEFAIRNIRNAMSLAETHFGIPQIIEADDLSIDKPDEMSVILYLSYFCSRSSPGQKAMLSWISRLIPEQRISNFSSDWINGKALGMLTHVVSEGKFDDHAGMNPLNAFQNIEQSMIAAEKLLGARRTITVEQFATSQLDDLMRLSYLSQFYHAKVTHNAPALIPPAPDKVKVSQVQYPDKIGKGKLVWVELDCSEAGYGKVHAEVLGKSTGAVQATVKEISSDEGYGTDQYKVIFEPPEIDVYTFSVFYGDSHVPGSPFSVNFHPPNADAVKHEGTTQPGKDKKDVSLTFDTREAGQGKLKAKASGEIIGGVPVKTHLEADGTYIISFVPPAPDVYIVDVLWGKFSAHAIGEMIGPVPLKVDQSQHGNEYNVTFKPPTADVYTVDVNWEGVPVPGSPFHLDLLPPPQPEEVECAVPTYTDPGEEAELFVDTSNAGSGKLRAICVGEEAGEVPVELVKMPGRTFQIAFTPPMKDLYKLSVLFDNKHVKGSPFTYDMRPGVEPEYGEILDEDDIKEPVQKPEKERPDASKCVIVDAPKPQAIIPVDKPTQITVDARNAGSGALEVVAKGAAATANPPKVQVVERDTQKGIFDVLFTPLVPGAYDINLLWFDDAIRDSPLKVNAMNPSDLQTFMYGKPVGLDADTDSKIGDLKAHAIHCESGAQLKVKVAKSGQKNKYKISFQPKEPGLYRIHILSKDKEIPHSPVIVRYGNPPKPDSCKVVGLKSTDYYIDEPMTFQVDVNEAGSGDLIVKASGPKQKKDKSELTVDPEDGGVYTVHYTPRSIGEHSITITWGGKSIPNSPLRITVAEQPSKADKCVIRDITPSVHVGNPLSFIVDTREAGPGQIDIRTSLPAGETTAKKPELKLTENKDKTFTAELVPSVPGDHKFEVLWSGESVQGSPFTVSVLDTETKQAVVDVAEGVTKEPPTKASPPSKPTEIKITIGKALKLRIHPQDEHQRKGELIAEAIGEKTGPEDVRVTQGSDGMFGISFNPPEPDHYVLTVRLNGEPVPKSPFYVHYLPAPLAEKVQLKDFSTDEIELGQPVDLVVDTAEAGAGTLTASCTGEKSGKVPVDVLPIGSDSKQYQVKFTPPQPDLYKLAIFYDETEIKGSPYSIDLLPRQKVIEKPVEQVIMQDALETLPPLEMEPEVEEPVTLEQVPPEEFTTYVGKTLLVKVKPTTEEWRKGEVHATAFGENVGSTDIKAAKQADDTVVVTFKPRDPDRYTVDIKLNDESIPRSPFVVNYIMPPSDPSKCKILDADKLPLFVEAGQVVTFLVDAKDAGPGDLTVTVDPPSQESEVAEPSKLSATRKPGEKSVFDVTYIPTSHGNHSLNLLWAGKAIPESPVRIMVVDPTKVEAFPHGKPVGVDIDSNLKQSELRAHVIHKDTNSQLKVKISKVQKGRYKFSFSPKQPGLYFLHISAQGREIPQSPIVIRYARPSIPEACKVEGLREKYYLGETVSFTVDAKEAGDGDLQVKSDKGGVKIVDNNDAAYSVDFIPDSSGQHKLAITWGDKALPKSPYAVSVVDPAEEKMVTRLFLVDRVGTEHQVDFPSELAKELPARTDNQLLLKVEAKTPEQKSGKLQANAVNTSTGENVNVEVSKVSDDMFHILFVPPVEGVYQIDANLNEEQVPNTPIAVNYTTPPAIASECKILGLEQLLETFQVDQPIPFQIDTRLAGDGKLSITADGMQARPKLVAKANPEEPRIVDVTYTPTAPGTHKLKILWSGDPIPESPLDFDVEAIPLFPHGKAITMEKDIDGKPNEIDVYAIYEDTKSRLKVKVSKVSKGKYRLTFNPKQPGLYAVHILLNKKDIRGSPIYIRYQGPPDASKCVVRDVTEECYLLEPVTFTVDATNAGSATLKVDVIPPSKGTKESELQITDYKDGTYAISYIPQVTGTHKFPMVWGVKRIPDSPVVADVKRRVATVKKSLGPYTNIVPVGQPVTLRVTNVAKYVKENFLTAEVSALESQDRPTVEKQEDGSYCVNFVPTVPDDYTLVVKIHEEHVKGSPFFVKAVEEPSLRGDFQHPDGIAHSDVEAGQSVCLIIPRDEAVPDDVSVVTNGPEGPCDTVVIDELESSYGIDFTPTVPGDYLVHMKDTQTDREVSNSPFKVTAIKKESDTMKVFVPEESQKVFSEPIAVGSVATFDIDTSKAGYGSLKVKQSGAGEAKYELVDKGDGIFECEISPQVEGACQLNVLWKNEDIRDSPFAVHYVKLSKPDKCFVRDVTKSVHVGYPMSFTVDTSEGGTGKLHIKTSLPASQSGEEKPELMVTDNKDKTYTAELVPNVPGNHEFEVLWSGESVQGSPFTVSVLDTATDPVLCELPEYFMEQPPIVEVDMEDVDGAEMKPGEPVDIGINLGDNQPGKLTARCTGSGCGDVPVDVVPVGEDSKKYQIKFVPPQPDLYKLAIFYDETEIKGSPYSIDLLPRQKVIEKPVEQVIMQDALETLPPLEMEPEVEEPVTLEQVPPEEFTTYIGKTLLVKVKPTTEEWRKGKVHATAFGENVGSTDIKAAKQADDTVVVTFKPRDPDRYTVDIKLNDESIPRSPFVVNYIMPPSDPSKCKILDADKLPLFVEAGQVVPFLVDAKDAGPGDLTVTVDPPSQESEVAEPSKLSATRKPGEKSVFDVTYIPTSHGHHSLNLLWAGKAIPESPVRIMVVDPTKVEAFPHGKPVGVDIDSNLKQSELRAHVIHKDTNTQLKVKISKVQKGRYKFSFSPKQPGMYFLHISAQGREIPQSPIVIRYARPSIPEACKVEGLREKYYLGETVSFTVDAKEAGDGDLQVKSDKGGVKVVDNNNAKYSVDFTPDSSGQHKLAITWGDKALPKSPYAVSVVDPAEEKMVTRLFLVDRIGAEHQVDFPSELRKELPATTDNQLLLKVEAKTPEQKSGKLQANAVNTSTGENVNVVVSKVSDDMFHVLFAPPIESVYQIDANLNEEQVPNTPIAVNYTCPPAVASECKILGLEQLPETFQVDQPIQFQIDTRLAGDGKLSITADGMQARPKLVAEANPEEPRIVDVTYTPTAPGTHKLKILWSGDPIPESPLSFDVEAIPLFPHGKAITMEKDIDGKPNEIDVYAIYEDTKSRLKVKVSKVSKGKYRLTFNPKQPGLYAVHILLNKKDIRGSPIYIRYQGPPNASKCVVRDVTEECYLLEPVTFTVDATNAGSATLKVDVISPSKGTKESEMLITDYKDGTYAISYIPQVTGTHKFPIVWGGKRIPDSPVVADVKRRVATVKKSLGPYTNIVPVGQPVSLRVTNVAKYVNENFLTAEVSALESQDRPTVEKQEDGSYCVNFVPTVPDDYTLAVKIHEEHVKGSPFFVKAVEEPSLRSDFQHPDGVAHSDVEAGQSVCLIIPHDEAMPDNVSVITNGPEGPCDTVVIDELESSYGVDFTPPVPGDYLVHMKDTQTDREVSNSPFKVTAIKKESDAMKVFVPEESQKVFSEPIPVGFAATFDIDTSKAGYGSLKVKQSGLGKADIKLFEKGEGLYGCEIKPLEEGSCYLEILWKNESIRGSPVILKFCAIAGVNLEGETFQVGTCYKFRVDCGQVCDGLLEVTCVDDSQAVDVTISEIEDQKGYECAFVAMKEGEHQVSVKYNGFHIVGSPFNVQFMKPAQSANMSFSLNAEGADTTDVSATAQSTSTLEDVPLQLTQLFGGNYSLELVPTQGLEYLVTIKCLVKITAKEESIAGSPFSLSYAKLASDASKCHVEGELSSARTGEWSSFFVNTEDAGSGELSVSISGESQLEPETTITAISPTKFAVKYRVWRSGKYHISVCWDDKEIPGSPFEIQCVLPNVITAFGSPEFPKEVIHGEPLEFTLKPETPLDEEGALTVFAQSKLYGSIPGIVISDGSGGYKCSVDIKHSGRYTVTVTWNNIPVQGTPFEVRIVQPPKPENVRVYGPGLADGLVGQKGEFTVETADAGTGTLSVNVKGPKEGMKINLERHPNEERTILAQYNPTSAGEYVIDVEWSGVHVPGSPFSVNIKASSGDEIGFMV